MASLGHNELKMSSSNVITIWAHCLHPLYKNVHFFLKLVFKWIVSLRSLMCSLCLYCSVPGCYNYQWKSIIGSANGLMPMRHQAITVTNDEQSMCLLSTDYNEINSLRPGHAISHLWTWSTLVQWMTCCMTAPSHYQNQYWLICEFL